MERFIPLVGLFVMVFIAWLFSENKAKISWKTVGVGITLQLIFGILILKTNAGLMVFDYAKTLFAQILNYTNEGSNFVFGSLNDYSKVGFVFMTMVLPTIIFFGALMSVLYHLGIMQVVVFAFAKIMNKFMGTSGSESLAAAANIFVGQTEAPLMIKPYLDKMTSSELFALMTGGMATVAGGVLAAFVGMGIDAGHLLAASVMSAPAALVCAKLMIPETVVSPTAGKMKFKMEKSSINLVDAAATGAGEGIKLALNVGGMVLAFVALIALLNGFLGWLGGLFGYSQLSFELIMGYLFSPFAFLMGVPWSECTVVGSFLGKKLVINEFVAYLDLQASLPNLSEKAKLVSTYALCGFANFSSIAIQIGGIGTLVPNRKGELAKLGLRSVVGGTLACFMTACIASLLS